MTVLVIADHDGKALAGATGSAVTAARAFGQDIELAVLGVAEPAVVDAATRIRGVRAVTSVPVQALTVEHAAQAVAALVARGGISHVVFVAQGLHRAVMPRAAALCSAAALSNVTGVNADGTLSHLIYAGGIIETVRLKADKTLFVTIRPTAFEPAGEGEAVAAGEFSVTATSRTVRTVSKASRQAGHIDLLSASRVVAGGRGLYDEEGFAKLDRLAEKIGAAVGSTRAVVDMQLASNESQIGQTGKIVAPDLYMAFGISGAIQHLAGMKDSKLIVAVNNDPEAPIFQSADYGLVADAAEVIEALAAKL